MPCLRINIKYGHSISSASVNSQQNSISGLLIITRVCKYGRTGTRTFIDLFVARPATIALGSVDPTVLLVDSGRRTFVEVPLELRTVHCR